MDLWPAIDVREGRCVRLYRGDFDNETPFGDPALVADEYVRAGAERLHIVDLDAARSGLAVNRDVIAAIVAGTGVPVQVGGGVRDEAAAEALIGAGVARVVLGTAAVEDPSLLARLSERWPARVVAGLDYRRNSSGELDVAVRGWTQASGRALVEILAAVAELALAAVVVTDIDRDGTGDGPDLAGLIAALSLPGPPVIASGGIAGASDLERLAALEVGGRRLAGAIVGRALLSGELALAEALAACAATAPASGGAAKDGA
jgi:phosphoribosylformimino-5-aminoimidazole carboxamide ribotide isomerase